VLWIFAWTLVFDAIETYRERMPKHRPVGAHWLRLWIAYALAIGHLNGFVSWLDSKGGLAFLFLAFHRWWSSAAGWLNPLSPFGYPLYSGICFGGICTLIHLAIVRYSNLAEPGGRTGIRHQL
jgi:hypothetical protein